LAWGIEAGFAPVSAGFAGRAGAIFSRNLAKIFFNMTMEADQRL
jgi:hypothetical protein